MNNQSWLVQLWIHTLTACSGWGLDCSHPMDVRSFDNRPVSYPSTIRYITMSFKAQSEPPSWDAENSSHFDGFGMFWAIPSDHCPRFQQMWGWYPTKLGYSQGRLLRRWWWTIAVWIIWVDGEFSFLMEVLVATSFIQKMDCPLPHLPSGELT